MKILGIDPGTRRIGYGIVEEGQGVTKFIDAGILSIRSKDAFEALKELKQELDALITKCKPELVAVEKLFFSKNQKTAIEVAQARGIILLSALEHGVSIKELAPNEVKVGLTGDGSADKKAIAKMIRLIFKKPDLEIIDDATDALAIALVGARLR